MKKRSTTVVTAVLAALTALAWMAPVSADPEKVLILGESVSGGAASREAQAATALGYAVEIATDAQWAAKTAADFGSYRALVLGDPTCSGSLASIDAAIANRAVWGPEVDGNVIVNGTDPVFHDGQGGRQVTDRGVAFAVDAAGKTGMYISLSCYYHGVAPNTPVSVLEPFGSFGATGVGCFNDAHIVATHPALLGLTDASLSNWSCSVHEAFTSWPATGANAFTVLAIARNAGNVYTAPDGSVGIPYILARGEGLFAGNIALAPTASSGAVGDTHTVTATLSANGSALAGKAVGFSVLSGPHAGLSGSATSNASGQATFTYTGTAPGTDTLQASFVDDLGATQSSNVVSREWTAPSNSAPTGNAGGPYAGDEGTPIAVAGTAHDADAGDVLTYSWAQAAGGSFDAGAACTFADPSALATAVTCTDDGEFDLELTIADEANPPVTVSTTVDVANVAPTIGITAPADGTVVAVGTAVAVESTFADAGSNDIATMACTVAWDAGAAPVPVTPSGTSCNAANTYTEAGVYSVTMEADDGDGGTGTDTVLVIVYDPSGGFVTGGGWIDSPAGAYQADPTLTGKANFGFVSKYKKGATTPTGETQFRFHAGSFNFHSASYQWLVVSGAKAQYKGTGTVNGAPGYSFLLTATDGQLNGGGGFDRFRIKVWDTASGDVVYDNVDGASDSADPQALGGGSIVIHK